MRRFVDIKNKTFGKLKAIERVRTDEHGRSLWRCKCNCGNEIIVFYGSLTSGHTKSCGCLKKSRIIETHTTHGHTKNNTSSREYNTWMCMKSRCYNVNHEHYRYYGGRGIKVCDRWENSFESFLEDMGLCPRGYTLERIDNDGDYEPNNCKWATKNEQACNKRNNRWIEFNGEKNTLSEWARRLGMPVNALHYKLKKRSIREVYEERGKRENSG